MELRFEDRGGGRVYLALEAQAPEGCRLRAEAVDGDGRELPAMALRTPRAGCFGVVVPEVPFPLSVKLSLEDAAGAILETLELTVAPNGEGAPSAPASHRDAIGLDDLCQIDLLPSADALWLAVDDLIDGERGTDVLHGELVAFVPGTELADGGALLPSLELRAFDEQGTPYETEPALILSRVLEPIPGVGTVLRYRYSIRIPSWLPRAILWARSGDPRVADGFTVATEGRLWELRDRWHRMTGSTGSGDGFHDWYLANGRAADRDLWVQSGVCRDDDPFFSIVTPVFETPPEYLRAAVESVLHQTYGHWELVLVNASPGNADVCACLDELASRDGRIRVVTLRENLGILSNTLEGIHAATGGYLAFLDHDDVLEPDALFEYAAAVRKHPDIALLYCDEDLLDGPRRRMGYFKPDFDLDLLLNHNYVTHFLCVSREVVDGLEAEGRFPGRECEGAQDYALTLLASEGGRRIWHVRRFLYHWRSHESSTATNAAAKSWTDDSGRRAIERYLADRSIRASIEPGPLPNMYDVVYDVPADMPVRVVIRRTRADGRAPELAEQVRQGAGELSPEVVIVDPFGGLDGAIPGDVRVIDVDSATTVGAQRNAGAADWSDVGCLVFLDDTVTPDAEGWLARLLGPLQRGEVAVTGGGILYEDRLWRHLGICLPQDYPRFVNHLLPEGTEVEGYYSLMARFTHGVSAVSGSAMAVGARAFRQLGGFDEGFGGHFDDVDLCLRARDAGSSVAVVPKATFVFHGPARRDSHVAPVSSHGYPGAPRDERECLAIKSDEARFVRRWHRYIVEGDPFYNPQLARESCHYQISR